MVLDELDGQRALADAAGSHHHQLVLGHRRPAASGGRGAAPAAAPAAPANAEHPPRSLPASGPGRPSPPAAGRAPPRPRRFRARDGGAQPRGKEEAGAAAAFFKISKTLFYFHSLPLTEKNWRKQCLFYKDNASPREENPRLRIEVTWKQTARGTASIPGAPDRLVQVMLRPTTRFAWYGVTGERREGSGGEGGGKKHTDINYFTLMKVSIQL